MTTTHPQAAAPRNSVIWVVIGVGIAEIQDDDHGWSSCDIYMNLEDANHACRRAVRRCKELLDRGSHYDVKLEEEEEEWYQTEKSSEDGGIVITASKGNRVAKVTSERKGVL